MALGASPRFLPQQPWAGDQRLILKSISDKALEQVVGGNKGMFILRTLFWPVIWRNENVEVRCLAGLNFDALVPVQLSGRVGHFQNVLSLRNLLQAKAAIRFRNLK